MASLMVASGMEDEGEYKEYMQQRARQSNDLEKKIEPCINEVNSVSKDVIGAENAKLGSIRKDERRSEISYLIKTQKDLKNFALSFVDSPVKKAYYKVMDKLGLFRPEKIINDHLNKTEACIEELAEIQDSYIAKTQKIDELSDELKAKCEHNMKAMSCIDEKYKTCPDKRGSLDSEMRELYRETEKIRDAYESAKDKKQGISEILEVLDSQIKRHSDMKRQLRDISMKTYTNSQINRILEAYEQI